MHKMMITPQEEIYSLSIPSVYIGKTVELLLYPIGEVSKKTELHNKKPSDFFGSLSVSEGEKFQEYLTNSRSEWDRNI